MFILINKPIGPTSHDIVGQLRKITGVKKIGHAGTLDPFASGLLIVGVGRESTKHLDKFLKLDKAYEATLKLGATTDTYDRTGHTQSLKHENIKTLKQEDIQLMIQKFIGPQKQIPPMYSAKKIKGKKLYDLARQGIEIEREPAEINIYHIEMIEYKIMNYELKIMVHCSSGTYIRSLAHDIGQTLGCGAYLEELKRTQIGEYKLGDAVDIDKLNSENWKNYTKNL